jgi:hypothetical protein
MLTKIIWQGANVKSYTVYRVNYLTKRTEPIGCVVDRRKGERHNNAADMLKLAQRLYSTSSIESHIFISTGTHFPEET